MSTIDYYVFNLSNALYSEFKIIRKKSVKIWHLFCGKTLIGLNYLRLTLSKLLTVVQTLPVVFIDTIIDIYFETIS